MIQPNQQHTPILEASGTPIPADKTSVIYRLIMQLMCLLICTWFQLVPSSHGLTHLASLQL